ALHLRRRAAGRRVHHRRGRGPDVSRLRPHRPMSRLDGVRGRIGPLLLAGAIWAGVGSSGVLATPAGPANDGFANAIALSGADASRSGDTNVGATLEPGEDTAVAGQPAGASVWYAWTAPMAGVVVIDTATSGFDTLVGVYTGSAVGALTTVASNDDAKFPPTSLVRFSATSGTVYRIRVDGYRQTSGTINLHLNEVPHATTPANDFF